MDEESEPKKVLTQVAATAASAYMFYQIRQLYALKKENLRNQSNQMAIQMSDPKDPAMAELNPIVTPMLTDMYQLSMTYSYWRQERHNVPAVFDLFFRKNPFKGGYTVFAGLEECLFFIKNFKYSATDIAYLKTIMSYAPDDFFDFLANLDCSQVKVYAVPSGTICFPRLPLMRIEGPLAICQLLETTLLCLTNFPSLVATNASRFKVAAPGKGLLEFGTRRAQGPDGAMSASKYCYLGGFDGTSNVMAGKKFGIPVKGTIAHSYICSFKSLDEVKDKNVVCADGSTVNFVDRLLKFRKELDPKGQSNMGELAAFASYAIVNNTGFLALIDTYDTLNSGNINFMACVLALDSCGYKAIGVRLDSGDLAALSKGVRKYWKDLAKSQKKPWIAEMKIVASDGINETKLKQFVIDKHEMDSFGIGTNLVTCQAQPALGCVFKLVEIGSTPCIKLSSDIGKVTIPSKKDTYRFYAANGKPIADVALNASEKAPQANKVFHGCPFAMESKESSDITPAKVEPLMKYYWGTKSTDEPGTPSHTLEQLPSLSERRNLVLEGLKQFAPEYVTIEKPEVYPMFLSTDLNGILQDLWATAKI